MKDLLRVAASMRVMVHLAHLEGDDLGGYDHEDRAILLRIGMTRAQTRSVLAHELAHAHYGHECDHGPEDRQADKYAAQLLISPERYAYAERVNPDEWAIAEELDVTVKVVRDYRRFCIQRIGSRAYGRSHGVLSGKLAAALTLD